MKKYFLRFFGRIHRGLNPLSVKLEDKTDLEIKEDIYMLYDSFRLHYIDEFNKLQNSLTSTSITQQQFNQKNANLNTNIISHTRDYILFEAQRRSNRNALIISAGLAGLSLLISVYSIILTNMSSEKSEKLYTKSLSLIEEQQSQQKNRDAELRRVLETEKQVLKDVLNQMDKRKK